MCRHSRDRKKILARLAAAGALSEALPGTIDGLQAAEGSVRQLRASLQQVAGLPGAAALLLRQKCLKNEPLSYFFYYYFLFAFGAMRINNGSKQHLHRVLT